MPTEHLEGRVTRVETQLSTIAADIEKITGAIQQQSTNMGRLQEATAEAQRRLASELTAAIQGVSSKFEAAQRPQWATWASWLAVLLAIGGIFGSIVMRAIDDNRDAIRAVERDSRDQMRALDMRTFESARERGELQERSRWLEKLSDQAHKSP